MGNPNNNGVGKKFDKDLEVIVSVSVRSGYNAKELGLSEEQAVNEALEALRTGKMLGQHRGLQN